MPRVHFDVFVEVGPRTKTDVEAYSTSVNEKVLTFKNGKTLTTTDIAQWLEHELVRVLRKVETMKV